jgi:hypothetical protein
MTSIIEVLKPVIDEIITQNGWDKRVQADISSVLFGGKEICVSARYFWVFRVFREKNPIAHCGDPEPFEVRLQGTYGKGGVDPVVHSLFCNEPDFLEKFKKKAEKLLWTSMRARWGDL